MEAASAAARAGSLQMSPAFSSRKEWRAVSENQPSRSAGNEDLERQKVGQNDERTIYEVQQRGQSLDMNFCAITTDATSEDVVLQQLEGLSRKREDLQQLEIQLRAQMIAKSEISEIKTDFDAQIKEHVDAAIKFQEQLRENEQALQNLERKMEEKDREIMATKRDNEAAWAKDDLLREQKKELASFRWERDHSEAERLQCIQQIHELQEHAHDKERQLVELQEQHRVTQEAIMYKDEQLREAQAWIARTQEMDALQSHSLQAELRERTEQFNQVWMMWQRQFAEMEGFHLHRIQQLQLELTDLKERNGSFSDDSRLSQSGQKNVSQLGPTEGKQYDANGCVGGAVLQNGNLGSSGAISLQNERMADASLGTQPALSAYIPPGQVNALHPFIMHQQGVLQLMNSNVLPPKVGHHTSSVSPMQQWHNQQGGSGGNEMTKQDQVVGSQNNHNEDEVISESRYHFQKSVNGDVSESGYMGVHVSQSTDQSSSMSSSSRETRVTESTDGGYSGTSGSTSHLEAMLPLISSNFHNSLALDSANQSVETKEYTTAGSIKSMADERGVESEQTNIVSISLPLVSKSYEAIDGSDLVGEVLPDMISGGLSRVGPSAKSQDSSLLDERSLLACVVRTIPAGGRIRISSTLPNRLAKMLAPLHWHDYKKKYGRLDEFVASHPDFFLIESDYIQLREGAQEKIAAKAAVAKVAAATAVSTTYSSTLPSVAVTPMAQAHHVKKLPSLSSKQFHATENNLVSSNGPLHVPERYNYQNGVNFNISSSASSIKILTKSKDSVELNGVEAKASHESNFVSNGEYVDKSGISSNQSKRVSNGRLGSHLIPRSQGRGVRGHGLNVGNRDGD